MIFLGCTGGACGATERYNAGAIRIDNDAANTAPLTLVEAYVDIGECHYAPWGNFLPATALPGQSLILTQTGVSGAPLPAPCNAAIDPLYWETLNFETAIRPGDTRDPSFYDCAPEGRLVPLITLVFDDGTTLEVTDADQVLNTGGAHRLACEGLNMATPWTAVDSANIVVAAP